MQEPELTVVIGAGRYPDGAVEINIRGGVEDSLVPSVVMEASIKRHSPNTKVINTYDMKKPRMSTRKNPTPFSLVRFMVPALCEYRGWAVYCDADQVVFDDIQKMLDVVRKNPGPAIFVAKEHGCTGVVLMDTGKLDWDAWAIQKKIDAGAAYGPMMRDLNGYGFEKMGDLGGEWNSRDYLTERTKLLHYTNLAIQPWKVPGKHPFETVWAEQLKLAIDEGFVNEDNLDENCRQILSLHETRTEATP